MTPSVIAHVISHLRVSAVISTNIGVFIAVLVLIFCRKWAKLMAKKDA